jgi:DNA (cytosine-5)-methyltransferase 1
VENSSALTFRGLGIILGDLASLGLDARWGSFSAADVGARHERQRIWIIAGHWNASENTTIKKRRFYEPCEESLRTMSEGISAIPDMGRKANGLAFWMDRLAAIGNGQVPAVVKLAWETLVP